LLGGHPLRQQDEQRTDEEARPAIHLVTAPPMWGRAHSDTHSEREAVIPAVGCRAAASPARR
jgi:hypothetical protein